MNSEGWESQKEIDPSKKDAAWINKITGRLRFDWRQLVSTQRAAENRAYLDSLQSMEKIICSFKDKQFKKDTNFIPLGIWNRIVNILIEEIRKMPPKVQLKASDAMAEIDKNNDIELFKLKQFHEQNINSINAKVGEPNEYVGDDNFQSNILKEFKRLNLDPNDPEDVDFFQQNDFPRLKYEEAGQKLLNIIFKENRFDQERVMDYVRDVLATYCLCQQTYVDELTGQILFEHIYPEEAYGIWSDKRDGSNDPCQGWLKNQTVRQWLGKVGNKFNWDKDWMQLLWAINYANDTKYTGFIRGGVTYSAQNAQGVNFNASFANESEWAKFNSFPAANLDWSLAYTYKVFVGYIEFSSIDATATYLKQRDNGELVPRPVDFNYFLGDSKETTEYDKESYYNEQMYKTYFLATSSTTQYIYNWGKVYYQQLYGAYDQFAKGTLMYYRLEGTSPVDISKFYIDFANLCAYRMKWVVYHAKPKKEQYIIPELIKVAKSMQRLFPQNAQSKVPSIDNILTQLINWKRENFIDLRDFPEVEGKPIPTIYPQEGAREGIDPLALGLQAVEQWAEAQIAEKVGLNDLRLGAIQNTREGYKQGMQEMESSYNSTGYLFRCIEFMKEYTAHTVLNYSQDIVRFKDSIPYQWLLKLMGEDEFENLKLLKDFAAHRYAIIIGDDNSMVQRKKVEQAADLALNARDGAAGITLPEWGLVIGEEDWRKALKMLAYFQYKADKKAHQQAMQLQQQQQQNAMQLKAMDGKLEQQKSTTILQGKQIDAKATVVAAQIAAKSKMDVKEIQEASNVPKQDAKTESAKQLIDAKANAKQQESLV